MRLITLLLFLIVAALGTLFAVLNAAPVPFDYYLGQGEFPLSLLLVVVLATGILLGILHCRCCCPSACVYAGQRR